MRYFQCDTLKQEDRKKVYQDVELTDEEKKSDRQGKILNVCGTILFSLVLIASFVCGCILITKIPLPENPFLLILAFAGRLALDLFAFVVAVMIGTFISYPIYKRHRQNWLFTKEFILTKL